MCEDNEFMSGLDETQDPQEGNCCVPEGGEQGFGKQAKHRDPVNN